MGRKNWLLFILFWANFGFSQSTVSGFVRDAISLEPLQGVSVFYDGTTIGTVTNDVGFFELSTENLMTSNLVISHVGHKTQLLEGSSRGLIEDILLVERAIQLDEVVLRPDIWSREKKMTIFKREFLGSWDSGRQNCTILNEEDIRLYFNKDENTLYAYASKPLRINNELLGYHIVYNLHDFEVVFKQPNPDMNSRLTVYFAGIAFFIEVENENKRKKRKYFKRRKSAYEGSVLHFMRALATNQLSTERFEIFKEKSAIKPHDGFKIQDANGLVEIHQNERTLGILYGNKDSSSIRIVENPFYIDYYGNNSPPKNIRFGGKMAKKRIGQMLPMDYGL